MAEGRLTCEIPSFKRGLSVHSLECGVDVNLPATTFVLIHGGQAYVIAVKEELI